MTHETILRMIETVDPSDTAKLDEIDLMVMRYVEKLVPFGGRVDGIDIYCNIDGELYTYPFVSYTRSRDALKAIRPEGCRIVSGHNWAKAITIEKDFYSHLMSSDVEEPAELHTIIQAIAYNRGKQ